MLYAYEDGMDRKFQNVGSDARRLPKKKNMTFNTWQKFEIKKFCVQHKVFMVMNIHTVALRDDTTLSATWRYHACILEEHSASIMLLLTCQTTQ